jgi:hypothetical protein
MGQGQLKRYRRAIKKTAIKEQNIIVERFLQQVAELSFWQRLPFAWRTLWTQNKGASDAK